MKLWLPLSLDPQWEIGFDVFHEFPLPEITVLRWTSGLR